VYSYLKGGEVSGHMNTPFGYIEGVKVIERESTKKRRRGGRELYRMTGGERVVQNGCVAKVCGGGGGTKWEGGGQNDQGCGGSGGGGTECERERERVVHNEEEWYTMRRREKEGG
jgi:hypothetical protein